MKTLLVMMMIVASGCAAPSTQRRKAPTAPGPSGPCPEFGCGSDNGTRLTGLTHGDRAGTIHAITLPSGEVIKLR